MTRYRISYYAHHFGTGHLRHAQKVAASDLFDLQVASTGPRNNTLLKGPLEYVELTPDVGSTGPETEVGPDYFLHYVPTGGLIQERFAELNRAWKEFNPDVVMVDVSVEVALFARLSGYRVAFRRMPGNRNDTAHQMAYSLADTIFGYFPVGLDEPEHLEKFGHKSHYLSVAEPADHASPVDPDVAQRTGKQRVVVQTSLASAISLEHVARAAAASPEWDWDVVGSVEEGVTPLPSNLRLHGVLSDPLTIMRSATVIISSAGHNAVVAAASCHRPVLLVPEERPYAEQLAFAAALHIRAGIDMIETWASALNWPQTLERAAHSDPHALARTLFVQPSDFNQGLLDLLQATAAGKNPSITF
ncbi:hypothetical protein [Arthrobacter sp. H35-D1]|uniref:hypothetical protein n=1 Tax=Arthrobacter sp. H35-D1 TaxID=3046202 RepID=UPI0024BA1A14|nr:hypothetical protein [Arthrobacter sp. H35-D1]MDJ0315432.1 hypothetical protein [Arthrobacter sp. H35-D1]